jgi:hypothetical protein
MSKSFRVDVTVNYRDGTEKTIKCNPRNVRDLKKTVEHFVSIEPQASSFIFTVCETHKES